MLVVASGVLESGASSRRTMLVNYLAPARLLHVLQARGVVTDATTIVLVSSCLHDPGFAYRPADWSPPATASELWEVDANPYVEYCRSKFAQACQAYAMRSALKDTPGKVYAINPGYFPQTRLFRECDEAVRSEKLAQPHDELAALPKHLEPFVRGQRPSGYYDLQGALDGDVGDISEPSASPCDALPALCREVWQATQQAVRSAEELELLLRTDHTRGMGSPYGIRSVPTVDDVAGGVERAYIDIGA